MEELIHLQNLCLNRSNFLQEMIESDWNFLINFWFNKQIPITPCSTGYRPQTKLREGNVFTPVCDYVNRRGVHVWQGAACQGVCMSGGMYVREHVRQGVYVAGEGVHGRGGCAWQGRVCMACIVGGHVWQGVHGSGACVTGEMEVKWAVCILLECILVRRFFL